MCCITSVSSISYCYKHIFIPYLFPIFSYFLLYLHSCLYYYAYAIYSYLILCISFPFFILDQTLSIYYLSILFPQPFPRFDQIYTLLIVPSHFSSFSCFYSILLSSLSHHHLILLDPKGCAGLSSYKYYLYSAQPQYSSISRRPTCTMSLSFNLV